MFGKFTRNSCRQTVSPKGIVPTSVNTMPIAMMGASVKRSLSAFGGMKSSLVKNFRPSAAGCRRPRRRNSLPNTLMTARFGPIRSWIIELCRRSAHVRMAARFRTNPTMMRILTIVQTSCVAVIGSLRRQRRGRRGRLDRRAPDELRPYLLEFRPLSLVTERRRDVGHLPPTRLARTLRLESLLAHLPHALGVHVRRGLLRPR